MTAGVDNTHSSRSPQGQDQLNLSDFYPQTLCVVGGAMDCPNIGALFALMRMVK
jgi:hypothetical protein